MGKKLHMDTAAEREANDIGRKFMNSTDVVGDMSRAYGADLSSVKIHTDSAAAGMAAQRGVDAFSTGKDVFFGRGVFDKNNPESRGLLAHELSHSLQQGVGGMGGMQQSAPMGAEQGGLIDWFRGKSKRDKREEKQARKEAYQSLSLSEQESQMAMMITRLKGDERNEEEEELIDELCADILRMDEKGKQAVLNEIMEQEIVHGQNMKMIANSYKDEGEGRFNALHSDSGAGFMGLAGLMGQLGMSRTHETDDSGELFVQAFGEMTQGKSKSGNNWTDEERAAQLFGQQLIGTNWKGVDWYKKNQESADEIANEWMENSLRTAQEAPRPEAKKRKHVFRWWLNL